MYDVKKKSTMTFDWIYNENEAYPPAQALTSTFLDGYLCKTNSVVAISAVLGESWQIDLCNCHSLTS